MLRVTLVIALALSFVSAADAQEQPSITFRNDITLGLTGRIETDSRFGTAAIGVDSEDFQVNTPRIGVDGDLFKKVDFEIERDLTTAPDGWRDVYANLKLSRAVQVRAGQFKLPFGEEALTSGLEIDFVRRALISTQIAPGRDVGAMVHGSVRGRHIKYATGYFIGDGRNSRSATTQGGGQTIGGRIVLMPLSGKKGEGDPGLQLGAMFLRSEVDDVLGLRGRTVFHDGVFFDRVYVNGARLRTGLSALWTRGSLKLSGEFMTSSDERLGMGFDGADLAPIRSNGWYGAAVWSHHPIELVARIERLAFEDAGDVSGNADRVLTFGSNWNIRRYLRLQADMILEHITDPERSPAPSAGGRFAGAIVRLQFGI